MSTLHEILWDQTTEVLHFRLQLLHAKPAGTRKSELIDALKQSYDSTGLAKIVASLGELERKAVA